MRSPDEPRAEGIAALQADFASRIFKPDEPPPACASGGNGAGRPVRRFDVYRNNVLASLTAVVKARYPVILRLLGERFFAGMARSFLERHPPSVPVLSEYGGELPGFLATFEAVSDLPYLADVARLEWAMHRAYHAADAVPLAPERLSVIPPDALAGARLALHPSVTVVASPYPVVSIWETNTFDDEVRKVGPVFEGEQALVARPVLDVKLLRMSTATLALALALEGGAGIGAAFEAARQAAPEADLSQALATLLGAGAIVDAEFVDPATGRRLLSSILQPGAGARSTD